MNQKWELKSFGECAELIKESYKPSITETLPYVGLEHIEQQTLQLKEHGYSSETISNKFKFKKGDILFGKLRPYFRKVICPDFNGVCSTDIFVVRAKEETDQKFLFYWMASKEFVQMADSSSTGTRMPRAEWDFLCNIQEEIPKIKEQKKISEKLWNIDQSIKNTVKMNQILEKTIQTIFKSWFIDFDGHNEFVDSSLGAIPKDWKVKNIHEIIEINPKRVLKKGTVAPFLEMNNIPINACRISDFVQREFISGTKFMNGDTLLARITPSLENGKTAYVDFLQEDEVGGGSTEYIVLRPKKPFPTQYGYCLARSNEFRDHAIVNMTGTSGRQRVPEDCFDNYEIIEPPKKLLQHFEIHANIIFKYIKNNAEKINMLKEYREKLLPKLLSGEIKTSVEQN